MGFLFTPLPLWVGVGGWIAAAILLALAIWKRPFVRLQDATLQHVWLALVTAITVLWASNAWLEDGLVLHLLGATLLVTLFDWTLALIAMGAVTVVAAIIFDAPWHGIGLTYLVYGALPVAVSSLLQRAAIAWLPHNLSSYHSQIAQREQRVQLLRVLHHPAIAHLDVTELAFDDAKRGRHLCANARFEPFVPVEQLTQRGVHVQSATLARTHRNMPFGLDVLRFLALAPP